MLVGIRIRELLLITLLTLTVVVTMSVAHLLRLAQVGVDEAVQRAETQLLQVAEVARAAVVRSPQVAPERALATDAALAAALDAAVAHTPDIVYAQLDAIDGSPLRSGGGAALPPDPAPLDDLRAAGAGERLWHLFRSGRLLEASLPLRSGDTILARVRLGIDTGLIHAGIRREAAASARLGALALVLSWVVALLVTRITRGPLRRISRQIEQLRAGDYAFEEVAWDLDFAPLAEQLRGLGEEIQSERLALLGQKRTLEEILDHLQDGILLVDASDTLIFANRALAGVLGQPTSEAAGAELTDLLPSSHPLLLAADRVRKSATDLEHARVSLASDTPRFREATLSAYAIQDRRERTNVLMLLEDLSGLRTLQELVQYGARVAEFDRTAASVAHEVRNPLNAMRINLEVLRQQLGQDPEIARSLAMLDASIASLNRIVEGLLDYLRPTQLVRVKLDVNALLGDLLEFFEAEASRIGIRIERDLCADAPQVEADEQRLRQVFVNLIQNAFQAMPGGGPLRVCTRSDGPWFVASVEDSGSGISPEDRERIFELYFTTRSDGSGIGLAMVRRIVVEHGGSVSVDSAPGAGSRFEVRLPWRMPAGGEADSPPAARP